MLDPTLLLVRAKLEGKAIGHWDSETDVLRDCVKLLLEYLEGKQADDESE